MGSLLKNKLPGWLAHRETGCGSSYTGGPSEDLHHTLYSNFRQVGKFEGTGYGAVFNFDFTPDGSMCVAAMEREALHVLDPHNSKLIRTRTDAHTDCVNCVKFLDSRMFVTCSDDTNVCLWDVRHMKHQVQVLTGHSNWVKNIEYVQQTRHLVTSGFDGSVYVWDLNSSDDSSGKECVFHTEGLMRTRLAADNTQLVIATRSGYLMLVHDLDLSTLKADLQGFKPTACRLWQQGRAASSSDLSFDHVFTRQRNRVEFIDDFLPHWNAEMIASLEVHPRGWCVVSRVTSQDLKTEITCVHDIQPVVQSWQIYPQHKSERDNDPAAEEDSPLPEEAEEEDNDHIISPLDLESSPLRSSSGESTPHVIDLSPELFFFSPSSSLSRTSNSDSDSENNGARHYLSLHNNTDSVDNMAVGSNSYSNPFKAAAAGTLSQPNDEERHRYHKSSHRSLRRLLMYLKEPNVGRGYIKELSFSSDGRVVASPYIHGLRLLAFNEKCQELQDCEPEHPPVKFTEVMSDFALHKDFVLTTKFSPSGYMLASGCLQGAIMFHQPAF